MKASIIIPTKNPGVLIERVLRAVLMQATNFDYEVLVIDSGSSDGTIDFIENLADPRVSLLSISSSEFGHGKTRNLGVSLTSGEYAVLITHDAMPIDEFWLANLVSVADSDGRIAGVFGRHVAYPDADPFTAHELETHFSSFETWKLVSLDDPDRYLHDQGYRQVLHFFSDNNALIRRSVWQNHPYPDVDFAEDQIWAKKIIEAGYKKAYAPDAVVMHSHNYGLFERLQRSFDESYAFYRFFGYVLSPNLRHLVRSWLALTRRDLLFAYHNRLFLSNVVPVAKAPFDNFMRVMGHYLGARGDKLPQVLSKRLSFDRKLSLGLRAGSTEKEF